MALIVGERTTLYGDVTQFSAIGAKAPSGVETMLGYGNGRLSRGYHICLLSGVLTPSDFEFSGNTMNSGGKAGLPQNTKEDDDVRPRIHRQILHKYGESGYRQLQMWALSKHERTGSTRLVKIRPIAEHDPDGIPANQYPMGGGSLQWRLLQPGKEFFVAAFVDAQADAQTPDFKVSIAADAAYDGRARLHKYLENVAVP
jgi:hypothetical protein